MKNTTMNTREAGEFLGISPKTLKVWRYQGRGPSYLRMARSIRYRMEDLQAFQEASLVNPEARVAKYASV